MAKSGGATNAQKSKEWNCAREYQQGDKMVQGKPEATGHEHPQCACDAAANNKLRHELATGKTP